MSYTHKPTSADRWSRRVQSGEDQNMRVLRWMDAGRFLARTDCGTENPSGSGGRTDWTYGGDYDSREEFDAAMAAGKPSERQWAVYQSVCAESAYRDPDAAGTITRARKRVWGEDGSEADADRWLAGDSNHWSSIRRVGKRPRWFRAADEPGHTPPKYLADTAWAHTLRPCVSPPPT